MSPEVIAALLGVTVGVVVERVARALGLLRFESSGWRAVLTGGTTAGDVQRVPLEEAVILEEAGDLSLQVVGATYTCGFDLFNGRELPTGLRNVRVVLICDDNTAIDSHPEDLGTGKIQSAITARVPALNAYDKLDVLNIPPRQFMHKSLRGHFDKDAAEALKSSKWKRVEFVAERPRPIFGILGSKTYRKTIAEP